MQRDVSQLASQEFDLLIIGAGIYGACAAWDATLRGLRVAVIDKGDFGAATSQNSLKTIHGGLRYLQQCDIIRMRESIRERRTLARIAPHLVHPLPCLMPTYGHLTKGREALRVALMLNDLIGFDRNRLEDPSKHLPRGRTISRTEILKLLPGIAEQGLTGGALWYDCQTHNSERLLLSFLLSAAERGAQAANYLGVTGFLTRGRRTTGVVARDARSGETVEIRARCVLNTAGPWTQKVLDLLKNDTPRIPLRLSTAMNLVTRRLIPGYAAGLSTRGELVEEDALIRKASRLYFIAPWRSVSLAGTAHEPYEGDPDSFRAGEPEIENLMAAVNSAYPAAGLSRADVRLVHAGLLPMKSVSRGGEVVLLKHFRIVDHAPGDGWEGLVSVMGVKYTTARDVAARAVDLVLRKLGIPITRSASDRTPIYGGAIDRFNRFLEEAVRSGPRGVSKESMAHLVYTYGSRHGDILAIVSRDPSLTAPLPGQESVIGAEVVRAARDEMALTLADVILRRTELGSAGHPGSDCLNACADLMAKELGWDEARKKKEIRETEAVYCKQG